LLKNSKIKLPLNIFNENVHSLVLKVFFSCESCIIPRLYLQHYEKPDDAKMAAENLDGTYFEGTTLKVEVNIYITYIYFITNIGYITEKGYVLFVLHMLYISMY